MPGLQDVFSRFVRSLAEQEQDNESPDVRHDLGTLMCWILERSGYMLIERAFKFEGLAQRRSSGFPQRGVDIVAVKPDSDGSTRLYRFVLKAGKFGVTEAGQTSERGNLIHDLQLAASARDLRTEAASALGDTKIDHVSVVAVHNGDLDRREVIAVVENLKARLLHLYGVSLDWWDAEVIIGKLMELVEQDGRIASPGDVSFLPPNVRPFVRAALSSVGGEGYFDIQSVERYLDTILPEVDERRPYDKGLDLRLERAGNEALLFVHMLLAEGKAANSNSVLPALECVERIVSRVALVIARYFTGNNGEIRKTLSCLRELLALYVECAEKLRLRLEAAGGRERSLALASGSEPLDYPYRVYRLLGYFCIAHAITVDVPVLQSYQAGFAQIILGLWEDNLDAVLFPVMDDHVVEIMLVWERWLVEGRLEKVEAQALAMVEAFALRAASRAPMPVLHQRATWPMRERDIDALVDVYLGGAAAVSAQQGTSQILPLAVYISRMRPEIGGLARVLKRISWQFWTLGDGDPVPSYARDIGDLGVTWIFDGVESVVDFAEKFRELASQEVRQPAGQRGLQSIDRIAWKLHRNIPPLNILTRKLPA